MNNNSPEYEWNSGLPDPRIDSEVLHQADQEANEIWCVPGCRLAQEADGSPIVPEWCAAWTQSSNVSFARDSAQDTLDESNAVVIYKPDESFHSCMRIDLIRVSSKSTPAADGALTSLGGGFLQNLTTVNGRTIGMNCAPGWSLSWKQSGFMVSDHNHLRIRTDSEVSWCAKRTDGCRLVGTEMIGRCEPAKIGNALCARFRFSDVNYGSKKFDD